MTWHASSPETGGALSLGEVSLKAGDEPPMHIHAREDEIWYVLDGTVLFQRGVERMVRGAGAAIVLPRGVQHGVALQSPAARILHIYTPAGIEQAFRELSVSMQAPVTQFDPAAIERVFQERGVTFVGPPLPTLIAQEQSGV
ncbi:MAG: cupin domain-containing protein [Bryobacteraceae bacterium]|nr:cupin domain-containing protein [Bryobacteraceae bacterium]